MSNYFSFRGKVYVGERDVSGNPTGLTHIGNVPELSLSFAVETLEHKESMSGQDLTDVSITTSKSGEISLTAEELIKETFALALNGTYSDVSTGSVASGEALCTAPVLGKTYLLAHPDVSSVVLKDHTAATIADTKYTVNAKHGSITFTDVTGLTGACTAGYSFAAYKKVLMFTADEKEYWMRVEGLNKVSNERVVVDFYKVKLNPTDGMAFINDELGSAPIKGKVLADTTKTASGALGQFGRMFIITAPS
jgi:hypothetical protein